MSARLAAAWPDMPAAEQRQLLQAAVARIDVHADRIVIALDGERLLQRLGAAPVSACASEPDERVSVLTTLRLTVPVALKRVGMEMRLMTPGEAAGPDPDVSLGRAVRPGAPHPRAADGETPISIDEAAQAEGLTRSYTTRRLRLSYLAPDITARLISGEHPPGLNAGRPMQDTRLPLDWAKQRAALAMA